MSLMPPRRAGCAVLVLALGTAACGGATGAGSHAARSGPAPLSEAAYGKRLERAGAAVQDAIALPRSKDPDALSSDLEDAAKALNDSARALDVTPPPAAGAAHEDL